jgi:hypothetical protein
MARVSAKDFTKHLDQLVATKKVSLSESQKFAQYFKRISGPEATANHYDYEWLEKKAMSKMSQEDFIELIDSYEESGKISRDQCRKFLT